MKKRQSFCYPTVQHSHTKAQYSNIYQNPCFKSMEFGGGAQRMTLLSLVSSIQLPIPHNLLHSGAD
jgi:hypothetical protein